jgi:hypothetical protein
MFGPHNPHLPTEILLKIFTNETLVYSDFFRFSCVDQGWRSFMDTNDIRKLMFLPLHMSNGQIAALPALDTVPTASVWRELPFKWSLESGMLEAEDDYRADLSATLWNTRRLHLLLIEFRTHRMHGYTQDRRPEPLLHPHISYQLLKLLSSSRYKHASATWRQMLIAEPPVERLELYVDTYDCNKTFHFDRS